MIRTTKQGAPWVGKSSGGGPAIVFPTDSPVLGTDFSGNPENSRLLTGNISAHNFWVVDVGSSIAGFYNTSFGRNITIAASSDGALAFGYLNSIACDNSLIGGFNNSLDVNSDFTFCIGGDNIGVEAFSSIIIGNSNKLTHAAGALVLGSDNIAGKTGTSANYSIIGGRYNTVYGAYSIVTGSNNAATGSYNLVSGSYHTITADNSTVLGTGHTVTASNQFVFGSWSVTMPSSYLEVVGNGFPGTPSNARELDNLGNEKLYGNLTVKGLSAGGMVFANAATGLFRIATSGDLPGGPFQPLENQRLSTTNQVLFDGVTANGTGVTDGYLVLIGNNTGSSAPAVYFRGGTLGNLRIVERYLESTDYFEIVTRNDDGTNRSTRQQIPRSDSLPTRFLLGLRVESGSFSVAGLSAGGMVFADPTTGNFRIAVAGTDYPSVSGVALQVPSFTAAGTLAGDAGFTIIKSGGIVRSLSVGQPSGTTNAAYLNLYSGGAFNAAVCSFYANIQRVQFGGNTTQGFAVDMFDVAGTSIDRPFVIVNASGGAITIGGSTNRPVQMSSLVTVGLDATAATAALVVNGPANQSKTLAFTDAGITRWNIYSVATTTDFVIAAKLNTGVLIDNPFTIVNASGGTITIGGTTNRPVTIPSGSRFNFAGTYSILDPLTPASFSNIYGDGVASPSATNFSISFGRTGANTILNGSTSSVLAVGGTNVWSVFSDRVNSTQKLQFGGVDTILSTRYGIFSNADDVNGTLSAGEACMGRKNASGGTTAWFGFVGLNSSINQSNGAYFSATQSRFAGAGDFLLFGGGASQISVTGTFTIAATVKITQGITEFNGKFGYQDGMGTAQTQATSKSTTVAFPAGKTCGTVTMNAAALAANTTVAFSLTSNQISPNDQIVITHSSGGTLGAYGFAVTPLSGSITVSVRNLTAASLSEALVLRILIIRSTVA